MNTQILIEKLTEAISYKYREDKTSPGITISLLKSGYYCSIIRYGGTFGNSKEVVCKTTADTLSSALQNIANQFLRLPVSPPDPIQELRELVWSHNDS